MFANELFIVCSWSDDQPFGCRDTQVQPLRHERVVYIDDSCFDSASSPLKVLPSNSSDSDPVTMIGYTAYFQLFLKHKWLTWMHQDSDKLYFMYMRLGVKKDIALYTWRKR